MGTIFKRTASENKNQQKSTKIKKDLTNIFSLALSAPAQRKISSFPLTSARA